MKKYIKENWNTFMFGVTTAVIVRALNIDDVSNSFKKGDCKLSCSPSDWHKDGKCGKNGCWHK